MKKEFEFIDVVFFRTVYFFIRVINFHALVLNDLEEPRGNYFISGDETCSNHVNLNGSDFGDFLFVHSKILSSLISFKKSRLKRMATLE